MKQILSVISMPKSSLFCIFLRSIFMAAVIIVINWLIPIDSIERNAIELYDGMSDLIFFAINNRDYSPDNFKDCSDNFVSWHTVYENQCRIDERVYKAVICDDYLLNRLEINLSAGTRIHSVDDIIISKTAGSVYNIGDEIEIEYYDENMALSNTVKRVCGIMRNDIFPSCSAGGMEVFISSLSENLSDGRDGISDISGFGFISTDRLFTNKRQTITTGTYFLEYTGSPDELLRDLAKLGVGADGGELLNKAYDDLEENHIEYIQLIITLTLLTVVIIIGTSVIDFYVRKKEISVKLLCGIPAHQIIKREMLGFSVLGIIITALSLLLSNLLVNTFQGFGISLVGFLYGISVLAVFLVTSFAVLRSFIKNENISEELRGE